MAKQSAYFTLSKQITAHDAKAIKQALGSIRGVISVAVGDGQDKVSVDYDSSGASSSSIEKKLAGIDENARLLKVDEHLM